MNIVNTLRGNLELWRKTGEIFGPTIYVFDITCFLLLFSVLRRERANGPIEKRSNEFAWKGETFLDIDYDWTRDLDNFEIC